MNLSQTQEQRQILSLAMQRSLHILQLPMLSLREYLTEAVTDNPLIDLDDSFSIAEEQPLEMPKEHPEWEQDFSDELFHISSVHRQEAHDGLPDSAANAVHTETFTEHLLDQLKQERSLPASYLPLCCFLVESLNSRGYLDEPIELLAEAMGVSVSDATQALYAVQDLLTPTGVGARSLQECLILQLVQSRDFNAYTLRIINEYLPLLAKNSIRTIARKLGVNEESAQRYCDVVRSLNPIPSRGFATREVNRYVVPEAIVDYANGCFTVHYNSKVLPRININQEYVRLLSEAPGDLREYLKKNQQRASRLQQDLENREATLVRVIDCVLDWQRDFILNRSAAPVPMTINDVSRKLKLHPSTISRAVKDKYIALPDRTLLLRDLFSLPVCESGGLSRAMILDRLKHLIDTEDKALPLSDESLRIALEAMNIKLSRRTVAAYRDELGIPAACGRRHNA